MSESPGLATHLEETPPKAHVLSKQQRNVPSPEKPTIVKTSPSPDLQGGKKTSKRMPSPLSQGGHAQGSPQPSGSSTRLKTSTRAKGKMQESAAESAKTPVGSHSNPLGIYDSTADQPGSQNVSKNDAAVNKREGAQVAVVKKTTAEAGPKEAPAMTRSKSNESRRASSGPAPAANFKSPSVVGMSKFAVSGGFDFETPQARLPDEDIPPLGADQPDIRKSSVLDSKFAPTQPSSSPAPPMARSKSQLTLLLERDKARIGDRHKAGSSSSNSAHKDDGRKKT